MRQELEILLSTVDAENSLQKLISDRNFLKCQLEELKNDSNVDKTELAELNEFLTLRNTQIQDLQQKINEANEGIKINSLCVHEYYAYLYIYIILFIENRANIRINTIQTMADAKVAIKFLFDVTAEDRKKLMVGLLYYNNLTIYI